MATQIPEYGGTIPNRETDTKEAFATNVYNLLLWIADSFVGFFNTAVTEVETNRADTQTDKDTTTLLRDETQSIKNDVESLLKYKGDWVAGVSFSTGESVTYTDGNIYVSKIDNNTIEPTVDTSTTEWLFKGRVSYVYSTITADYTASVKDFLYIDTLATGVIIVTLPLSPSENDTIGFLDIKSNLSNTPLTIARNGNLLMGLAEDMIVDTNNISFELIFTNNEWRLV